MIKASTRRNWSRALAASVVVLLGRSAALGQGDSGADISASIRVRAYMVVDERSGLPGLDVSTAHIQGVLNQVYTFHPGTVTVDVQTNPTYPGMVDPKGILDYYRDLPDVRPTDVLVFYYAGHGATDPRPGKGHWLATSGGAILRSSIREAMQARKPRLVVMLTDCCSSISQAPVFVAAPAMTEAQRVNARRLLDDLFFRSTGVVDWTAATYDAKTRIGEYAWFNGKGGLFTDGLHTIATSGIDPKFLDGNLDKVRDGFVSWAEFGKEVGRATDQSYQDIVEYYLNRDPSRLSPEEARTYFMVVNQPHQTPQHFSDGEIAPRPPAWPGP